MANELTPPENTVKEEKWQYGDIFIFQHETQDYAIEQGKPLIFIKEYNDGTFMYASLAGQHTRKSEALQFATKVMTPPTREQPREEVVEQFADMEHRRWSKWQEYLHSKCIENEDGSLNIPAHLVVRWKHQISTPYSQLTEPEKEADRREVRPYIEHMRTLLSHERSLAVERQREVIEGIPLSLGGGVGKDTEQYMAGRRDFRDAVLQKLSL